MRNLLRNFLIRILAVIIAGGFLAACGPTYTDIKGKDQDAFLPLLRVTIPIGERSDARDFTKSTLAMEMDLSTGEGNDSQSLSAGEQVSLELHRVRSILFDSPLFP